LKNCNPKEYLDNLFIFTASGTTKNEREGTKINENISTLASQVENLFKIDGKINNSLNVSSKNLCVNNSEPSTNQIKTLVTSERKGKELKNENALMEKLLCDNIKLARELNDQKKEDYNSDVKQQGDKTSTEKAINKTAQDKITINISDDHSKVKDLPGDMLDEAAYHVRNCIKYAQASIIIESVISSQNKHMPPEKESAPKNEPASENVPEPGKELVPEKEQAPEVGSVSENNLAPAVQSVPGNEAETPKDNSVPEVELVPENDPAPENPTYNSATKVEPVPENELGPDVPSVPGNEAETSKDKSAKKVELVPENEPAPENPPNNSSAEVESVPENELATETPKSDSTPKVEPVTESNLTHEVESTLEKDSTTLKN